MTIAYEFLRESIEVGDSVTVLDAEGQALGNVEVVGVRAVKAFDRTIAVKVRAPREYAKRIAGIRIQEQTVTRPWTSMWSASPTIPSSADASG